MKPFDNYEIHGCRTYAIEGENGVEAFAEQCPDSEAEYWTLFGHIPGQGLETIRDFPSREAAEEMFQRITGIPFGETEVRQARLCLMHAGATMLAALQDVWKYGMFGGDLVTIVRQAIAEATGGQPIPTAADQQEALLLASQYIQYVKERNPELHQEADGTPSIEQAVAQAIGRAA